MTALHRIHRTLALAAIGLVSAGVGHAQTWDIDACTGGTKAASGYTGCRTSSTNTSNGTLNVTAYSSTGGNFTAAQTSINNGGSWLGVWSPGENNGTSASTNAPHHAIDNVTTSGYGSAYELVHLQFSKAVDLGTLTANWVHTDADFQVYRWNYNASTPNPTITNFGPGSMTGWQLVKEGQFAANVGQVISDTTYFSSHWLVSTAFGHNNDGFKLGTIHVTSVCQQSQIAGGGCGTVTTSVPVPATWALVLLAGAGAGATAARRRRA
jgi:hypothetical protein